jgi:hypothetical protein
MKIAPVVLALLGAFLLVLAIALGIWAGMPANPLATLKILVLSSGPFAKLAYLVLTFLGIWIAILVVAWFAKGRRSSDPSALALLSLAPPGAGLAATLMTALSIGRVMQQTHTTELMVIAPSLAEALAPLAIGLLLGAAAAVLKAKAAAGAGQTPT